MPHKLQVMKQERKPPTRSRVVKPLTLSLGVKEPSILSTAVDEPPPPFVEVEKPPTLS